MSDAVGFAAAAGFLIFPVAMVYTAVSDLLTMTIPNRLSLALLAAFAVLAPMVGMAPPALGLHLAAAAVVFAVGFLCFAAGWMGGGDVKIAAVVALWLGPVLTLNFVAFSAIFGGLITVVLLSLRRLPLPAGAASRAPWLARLHDAGTGVPYGIALAAAALVLYPRSLWTGLLP